jgi:deoxyribodipyrimidine photo-lyase
MNFAFHSTRGVPRKRAIVWLRRDLRLDDNVALAAALREAGDVCIAFNIDPALLASERTGAPIVQAFFTALAALRAELRERGSDLALLQGDFSEQLGGLARRIGADAVYFNDDYEPSALRRDEAVCAALEAAGIAVSRHLDHVYFGADEILTEARTPYKVFTPYFRRWYDRHRAAPHAAVPSARALDGRLLPRDQVGATRDVPEPSEFGFSGSPLFAVLSEAGARERLSAFLRGAMERYAADRDVPALDGTSGLSPHLRAGTIGIRTCVAHARDATWLKELAWRDFYQMILRHFPYVADGPFVAAAANVEWSNDRAAFDAWCEGRTGYPIVDAAMRQLNCTGWMHNRLRMIVASFLSKDLLVDWRWGERYFERHLSDADLAQNNGGWQWAASTGTDAAPYFRIFNPVSQGKKFDPDGAFVRRWLPDLAGVPDRFVHEPWKFELAGYPPPIVDRAASRERALRAYAAALHGRRPIQAGPPTTNVAPSASLDEGW